MSEHVFRAGFLFCGSGPGAMGFEMAGARLGADVGRFENAGGIDNDAIACADFEYLTRGKATCADLARMTPADLRRAWGDESPDAVFTSPPCVGMSGLLGKDKAKSKKYQEMNELVFKGIFLLLETWPIPPGLIILENVPRVVSRGAEWLIQVRQFLASYGYVFHEESHDLRRIGNLGAHRRRYLLVARLPWRVPAYLFRPPLHAGLSCGDVIGGLPLPGDPAAGPMHAVPALSMVNWIRLASIPVKGTPMPGGRRAKGDWRDLPKRRPEVVPEVLGHEPRNGAYGVTALDEPAKTVRGRADIRTGEVAVADPIDFKAGRLGVKALDEAGATVTGESYPTNGPHSVADDRVSLDHEPRPGVYEVGAMAAPTRTVTGASAVGKSNGPAAVADDRLGGGNWHHGAYGVGAMGEAAATVTGGAHPSTGPKSVADDRVAAQLALGGENPNRHHTKYGLDPWNEPAPTVTGATRPGSGSISIADERVAVDGDRFKHSCRVGAMGEPTNTITGGMSPSNGAASVADDRIALGATGTNATATWKDRPGLLGVASMDEPMAAITAKIGVCQSNTPAAVADNRIALAATADNADTFQGRPGLMGVGAMGEPLPALTATMAVSSSNTVAAIADERVALTHQRDGRFVNQFRVGAMDQPAGTVTGDTDVQAGAPVVADGRLGLDLSAGAHLNLYRVTDPANPAPTITGASRPGGGAPSVADDRLCSPLAPGQAEHDVFARYQVNAMGEPTPVVAGSGTNGAYEVADERLAIASEPRTTSGAYGVLDPTAPAYAVTASACIDNGAFAVADERPKFGNCDRVGAWNAPTGTITHAPAPSSGGAAAADPRVHRNRALPACYVVLSMEEAMAMLARGEEMPRGKVPVIFSPWDGTWHRPLTDLDLGCLQGLPATWKGQPLKLNGKSRAVWRKHIGNAVPVGAGEAIGSSAAMALLASATGAWTLSATGVWVRREDGATEYEVAEELGYAAA